MFVLDIEIKKNEIILNEKEINNLDKFVISLIKILEKYTSYVIVSGYLAIFFGRTRATEDVDVIVKKCDLTKFIKEIEKRQYWVVNATDVKGSMCLLEKNLSIRIARKNKFVPNLEIKFAKTEIDKIALKNRIKVIFDKNSLYFSPIELQIAYKIFLGSDKDKEDARHLYNIFSEKIDKKKLENFSKMLKVDKKLSLLWR